MTAFLKTNCGYKIDPILISTSILLIETGLVNAQTIDLNI